MTTIIGMLLLALPLIAVVVGTVIRDRGLPWA